MNKEEAKARLSQLVEEAKKLVQIIDNDLNCAIIATSFAKDTDTSKNQIMCIATGPAALGELLLAGGKKNNVIKYGVCAAALQLMDSVNIAPVAIGQKASPIPVKSRANNLSDLPN
jgi:hypothetical protein